MPALVMIEVHRPCYDPTRRHRTRRTAGEYPMLTLTLDQDTEYRLSRAAQEAGRPVAELLRVAVLAYLEDLDDAEAADRAYERYLKGEERAFSLEDVERDLGVAR